MFNNIEVTAANYAALRGLAENGYDDILFYDSENLSGSVGAIKVIL